VFNKNASAVLHLPFFTDEHIQSRRNVLLLGDGPGDAAMAHGLPGADDAAEGGGGREEEPAPSAAPPPPPALVLRVGLLNDRVQDRLAHYQDLFDIVITGDGDLSLIQHLLDDILQQPEEEAHKKGSSPKKKSRVENLLRHLTQASLSFSEQCLADDEEDASSGIILATPTKKQKV